MSERPKPYQAREVWLSRAIDRITTHFSRCNYAVPLNVRVSCGLPSGRAFSNSKRSIGEAWSSTASGDKHHEIFISPTIAEPLQVLGVLVHELVHVTVGLKAGHRGAFIECARAVGLVGPWTSTDASDTLLDSMKVWLDALGEYPHAPLSRMTNGKKKQTTRMLKVGCPSCGYTTRIAMSWILWGVPSCPNEQCDQHGEPFEVSWPEGVDGEVGLPELPA